MYFNENNNDDDEDGFNESFRPLDELLLEFSKAKKGEAYSRIEEDEFEFLITFFESENDRENVEYACNIGIENYPFSSELLLRKTAWLTNQTKFGQALKTLDALDAIAPENMDALMMRVDIYCDMNRYEDAVKLLEMECGSKNNSDKIDILMELSELYDELEEFDNVYHSLKRILEIDFNNEEALLRICFWTDICSKEEESIELYNNILEQNSFHAMVWYNLGTAYQGLKLYEKAVESYEYCIALDNDFEYAYRNVGDAYIHLKEYDKAIEVLEKHTKMGTPEDIILESIGLCWEKKKDYTKARKYYLQASALSPEDDSLFFKIGETFKAQRKWESAMEAYLKAMHLNVKHAGYRIAIGNCFIELNAPKEAIEAYLDAVELKPANKGGWQALIKGLYMVSLFQEAIEHISMAQEYCGAKPEFDYYLATCNLALGKTKEALLILENILHSAPQKLNAIQFLDDSAMHHPAFAEKIARFKKKK